MNYLGGKVASGGRQVGTNKELKLQCGGPPHLQQSVLVLVATLDIDDIRSNCHGQGMAITLTLDLLSPEYFIPVTCPQPSPSNVR